MVEDSHALPTITHDSCLFQYGEMPGDIGLVNVCQFVQLAHTLVVFCQCADY